MGIFSSGSAKRAAQVQASKLAQANTLLREQTAEQQAQYDPYTAAGQTAIGGQQAALTDVSGRISDIDPRIAGLREQQAALQPQADEIYDLARQQDPILAQITSGDMNAYQQTPGYDFRMQEGARRIEQSAAARGGLFSGQTGKALTQYGQDYGTQEYDNYLSRLYNQLGAVTTQIGGRQSALGAGQSQINAGINLLGQDYKQIAAQMGLSKEYQNLINTGFSAADASARLGFNSALAQSGNVAAQGDVYASGMTAKSNQLLGVGESVINIGSAAAGAYMGLPPGTIPPVSLTGGGAQPQAARSALPTAVPQAQPWANPANIQMGQRDPNLPWLNQQQAQTLKTTSGYQR